jgi:hypothetical protein
MQVGKDGMDVEFEAHDTLLCFIKVVKLGHCVRCVTGGGGW